MLNHILISCYMILETHDIVHNLFTCKQPFNKTDENGTNITYLTNVFDRDQKMPLNFPRFKHN